MCTRFLLTVVMSLDSVGTELDMLGVQVSDQIEVFR